LEGVKAVAFFIITLSGALPGSNPPHHEAARAEPALALYRGARYMSGDFPDKASGGARFARRAEFGRNELTRGP
jgi:hypothetical protein